MLLHEVTGPCLFGCPNNLYIAPQALEQSQIAAGAHSSHPTGSSPSFRRRRRVAQPRELQAQRVSAVLQRLFAWQSLHAGPPQFPQRAPPAKPLLTDAQCGWACKITAVPASVLRLTAHHISAHQCEANCYRPTSLLALTALAA